MKIKNLLAAAALCLFSGTASAQVNSYGGLYLQYNPTWLVSNYDNVETTYVNGFTLGYFRSIGIGGDNVPLFLEVGGNLNYGFHTESQTIIGVKVRSTDHLLSLNVPVNFGYSIRLGDNLALNPYVGIRMRLNLLGVEKTTMGDQSNTINLYSRDDMDDARWNRFQIGGQIGAKMIISESFFVEAAYNIDFMPIQNFAVPGGKDYKARTHGATLGFGFVF